MAGYVEAVQKPVRILCFKFSVTHVARVLHRQLGQAHGKDAQVNNNRRAVFTRTYLHTIFPSRPALISPGEKIDGRVHENAQVHRDHIVLQSTVVDVPRKQHEVAVAEDVQTRSVAVPVRHGQTQLGRVFPQARKRDPAVHSSRYNRHDTGRGEAPEKVSVIFVRFYKYHGRLARAVSSSRYIRFVLQVEHDILHVVGHTSRGTLVDRVRTVRRVVCMIDVSAPSNRSFTFGTY